MRLRKRHAGMTVATTLVAVGAQTLPYIPTRILLSSNNTDIVYIIAPSSTTSTSSQLLEVNISTSLEAASLQTKLLSSSLPFLEDETAGTSYIPAVTAAGSIEVYSGSCSSIGSVYTYSPSKATWQQITPSLGNLATSSNAGAPFLSSAFAFSQLVSATDSQSTVYIFGGMCPTSSSSNSSNWQQAAIYSNRMMKITPSGNTYSISQSAPTGSIPILEAGFTLTALTPTVATSSNSILTQAQNYILLGGHTQTAFLNMSQIAVYSLPQENWSYQTIDAPGSGQTELKSKITTTPAIPDSRSGHTAVLSADGSEIIVFGGWVGNVSTPANPQIAILKLGSGYGGTGDWQWSIPTTTGTGLSSGQGIYGHGAVMLPGNVMMISGGTIIGATTTRRRAAGPNTFLFNATSFVFVSSYTNPSYTASVAAASAAQTASTSADNTSKKIGLGVGLTIGLIAIAAAVAVYFWYDRRLKHRQEEQREKDLVTMAMMTTAYQPHPVEKPQMTDRGYVPVAYMPTNNNTTAEGHHAAISRKAVASSPKAGTHGCHQPLIGPPSQAQYDFNSGGHLGVGVIHPIYEADEEAESMDGIAKRDKYNGSPLRSNVAMPISSEQHLPNNNPALSPVSTRTDPFRDPSPTRSATVIKHHKSPLASNPANFSMTQVAVLPTIERGNAMPATAADLARLEREQEVASWVADWTAADALLHGQAALHSGRISPSKESSGRTTSELSERSMISASLVSRSSSSRANSLTRYLTSAGNWNPFTPVPQPSQSFAVGTTSVNHNVVATAYPSSSTSGETSYTTAQTTTSATRITNLGHSSLPLPMVQNPLRSFTATRAESHSLLGQNHDNDDSPGSPSKNRRAKPVGWLGSLKRVFTGEEEWLPASGSSLDRRSPIQEQELAYSGAPVLGSMHNVYIGGNDRYSAVERRNQPMARQGSAASAMFWHRKQGRGDWESTETRLDAVHGPNASTSTTATQPEDEEWDVERAVRERVVQVMFTVPKEKLRVVNHDISADPSEVGSVRGSVKSVRSMKSTRSVQGLRRNKSFGEMERLMEGSMSPVKEESTTAGAAEARRGGAMSHEDDGEGVVGQRIEGRKIGEVIGRPETPDRRKSRVLDMVGKIEVKDAASSGWI